MKQFYLILFCIAIITLGCKSPEPKAKTPSVKVEAPTKVEANTKAKNPLPLIPEDLKKRILEETDNIDITFYADIPASLSLQKPNTNNYFATIATDAVADHKCKPFGRAFFQSQGDIFTEAEFFVSDCGNYYVFYYNDNKYGQMMTADGSTFYDRFLQMIK